MIRIRPAAARGHFDYGWLDTRYSFSFGDYHDPAHVRFRALRVLNEDRIQPGRGFGMHPHADMEIVTVVVSGFLTHRDSLGTLGTIGPGEVQHMTAGTGITHSEFNTSATEPVHLYQVWLIPRQRGLRPGYRQRAFPETERRNRLQAIATPDGAGDILKIAQDAWVYRASLDAGRLIRYDLAPGRHAWLQVIHGRLALNGTSLGTGDGAAVSAEASLAIIGGFEESAEDRPAAGDAEFLLFDLV